ncbi:MAG TPA: lipid A deacylase LpxR family protein [Vitreimonas sp.]|uniref:lipid A deacylase LpxR family protein n=1 Tax=Vitreimonas sp. TaxID=3069702 RepID=UPI002D64392F|nr:lipid A deacylase LpxR family protein [Vitreimonas sp.]HYD86721.1 lipid A deacylase LpxR family protein [Vitreimonas sp.]
MLTALPGAAFAQDADTKGVFSLTVENDSLSSGADRNYTSGIRLGYVSPAEGAPDWLDGAGGFTRALSNSDPDFWGFAIGQSIFTPEDINAVPAPPDQHPYAGWLYMQISVGAEEDRRDGRAPRFLDTYELELGIVGPSALGEEAQRGIHEWLGAPDPQGWDSQLEDEVAFAVSFDRRWRALRVFGDYFGGLEADLTPSAGASLGTLRTEARVGLAARVGQGIDSDYGPPRVRPSLASVEHFRGGNLSWSLFAGVQGRAVAHNLFLDGNTFEDSASVERNPYVLDMQTGFSISAGSLRLAYTYVWRTEEFETQPTRQDFGALSLSARF